MNVRAQVGLAGSDATAGGPGWNPAAQGVFGRGNGNAGCVNQKLLDLGGCLCLQRRHGSRTNEDAINRHQGAAVSQCPLPGNVVGSPLGGADATTNTKHQVGGVADVSVCGEEQVVQVLPGVVPASVAVLDLNDHRGLGYRLGDGDDLANLRGGARLECNIGEAGCLQVSDELRGLFKLGDARRNHHAIQRRTRGTGLGDNALGAELQVPQVGVQEHGVELRGAARVEKLLQLRQVLRKDRLGDLPATGQFSPVTRIGRCGDDFWVNGCRRHARKQDGGAAGEAAKRGLNGAATIGKGRHLGLVGSPVHWRIELRRRGEECVATSNGSRLNHANPAAQKHLGGDASKGITRTNIKNPLGTGLDQRLDLGRPINRFGKYGGSQVLNKRRIDTGISGPGANLVEGASQQLGVERSRNRQVGKAGSERLTAANLRGNLCLVLGLNLLARQLDLLQIGRGPGNDNLL